MRRKDREVKDKNEIEKIISQCKTCHVSMVDDKSIPYIVPLSYGYKFLKDNTLELYFHSALEGKKIDVLKKNNNVCFEMSYEGEPVHSEIPCNSGYYFASIIGYGKVIFIHDISKKCDALSIMFKHQTGKDFIFNSSHCEDICVYKIVSTEFTGKKNTKPVI